MKTIAYETQEEWLIARRGKITGSRAKEVVNIAGCTKEMLQKALDEEGILYNKFDKKEALEEMLPKEAYAKLLSGLPKKVGFYKLIAERLAIAPDGESPMDRGHRIEEEALQRLAKELDRPVDSSLVMWMREDNENIAVSPDGVLSDIEAAEVKCLASEKHIEALLTKKVPSDYVEQVIQYFTVNDKLQMLFFVFYDPRIGFGKDFFYLEITRGEMQEQVELYLALEQQAIEEVNAIVNELTF